MGISVSEPLWDRTKAVMLANRTEKIAFIGNAVPQCTAKGTPQEQLAIVDMLVLAAAEKCIGINYSTFSIMVPLLRHRCGLSPGSCVLVDLPKDHHERLMEQIRDGSSMADIRETSLP